ncbi:MAG TPA: acyl-CoA reductase [Bryobacteraceae bacterium]|nr:acyl-CoA reductase [Bryobacteraceae bacterium]
MDLRILVPELRSAPVEEVVRLLAEPAPRLLPFDDACMEFCAGFSAAILRDREAAAFPELVALGFWMRKAELARLREDFRKSSRPDVLAAPRGVVFHIPPSNVDTIFVYSWLLSALAGNRNVVRLSSRRAPQAEILLRLWRERVAQAPPRVRSSALAISYGHDDEITRALSLACDVRVIWGGDATVSRIREAPLPPHARDITFPDRASLAALDACRYHALDEAARARLADQFFNDAYWFDQMACSSPRAVIWRGTERDAHLASDLFWAALGECVARRGYALPAAIHMRKLVFSCESILDLPVAEYRRNPAATVLRLDALKLGGSEHCGGGLFFEARVNALEELVPALGRRHQTLTHFGFEHKELQAFAALLAGGAIDRMVPVGQALQFHRFWDGYDLLHEFCRLVYCEAPPAPRA